MGSVIEDLQTAIQLGNFVLLRKLGSSPFSDVHQAQMLGHAGLETTVVLKWFHAPTDELDKWIGKFAALTKKVGQLNHPNLVRVVDFGELAHRPYLVLEWVDGTSLSELLAFLRTQNQTLPITLILDVFRQIAEGLMYLHEAQSMSGAALKLIHGALNPHNVLMGRYGEVKLDDGGLALVLADLGAATLERLLPNHLPYYAPEQIAGGTMTVASDLFSLGCLGYEMLTLNPLFARPTDLRSLSDHLRGDLADKLSALDSTSPQFASLLRDLLQGTPSARPESARAVRDRIVDHLRELERSPVRLETLVERILVRNGRSSFKAPEACSAAPLELLGIKIARRNDARDSFPPISDEHLNDLRVKQDSPHVPAPIRAEPKPLRSSSSIEAPDQPPSPDDTLLPDEPRRTVSVRAYTVPLGTSYDGGSDVRFRPPPTSSTRLLLIATAAVALLGILWTMIHPLLDTNIRSDAHDMSVGVTSGELSAPPATNSDNVAAQLSNSLAMTSLPPVAPAIAATAPPTSTTPAATTGPMENAALASTERSATSSVLVASSPGPTRTAEPPATSLISDSRSSSGVKSPNPPPTPRSSPPVDVSKLPNPAKLEPAPNRDVATKSADGFVTVNAVPYAEVYLNGTRLIGTTPLQRAAVPAGSHTLTFKAEDGRMVGPIPIRVETGQVTRLITVKFE